MGVAIAWTLALNAGVDIGDTSGFQGVADIGGGRLVAITLNGNVYRSADGGATWALIVSPIEADGYFVSRLFSPALNVAFTAQTTVGVGGNTDTMRIWRTMDGGNTWAIVYTYTSASAFVCFVAAYDFAKVSAEIYLAAGLFGETGITATTHAFARSVNSGASWEKFAPLDVVAAGNAYENVLVLASGRIIASRICGDGAGADPFDGTIAVWYSDDSGATWTQSADFPGNYPRASGAGTSNKNVWALAEVAPNVVLASGGFINDNDLGAAPAHQILWIWGSADGGATWSRIPVANIEIYEPDNVTAGWITTLATGIAVIGYGYTTAAKEPGWRLTEDGGVTWTKASMTWAAPPNTTFYSPSQMVFILNAVDTSKGTLVSVSGLDQGANGNSEIWVGAVTGLPLIAVPEPLPWPDTLAVRGAQPTATKFVGGFKIT